VKKGLPHQVLLGVTGSGKTFTMANVVQEVQRPTLVLAPNKTLAAQLYREFKDLFPNNAVDYFVSYYDYYQPEAFIPASDTYIEKDSSINDELEKMRLASTQHLLERRDVLVVASVSCIYGIGSPDEYRNLVCYIEEGQEIERDEFLHRLVEILYERNDNDFYRGTFRVRGDVVDVFPANEDRVARRIEFFGDEIDAIYEIDALTGERRDRLHHDALWPTSNYVTRKEKLNRACKTIEEELDLRFAELKAAGKLIEAERLNQRTLYDLEMIREMGTCKGIENYSRHLDGRRPGEPPNTLLNYFPKDFLLVVDESHVAIPQIGGMFNGDRSRKTTLVDHGFRLPSALDNRPLRFEEFQTRVNQVVYVSATPAEYEKEKSGGLVVEQVVRPTGLIDPQIEVRPATGQVDDLLGQIRERVEAGERVLVTTLTKRMAEELTEYYLDVGLKVKYLHSDITTLERSALIRELREGTIDVLIGINLLREGLDIPEVSLVAILDADKEGFLRSAVSLIQTTGRAARNVNGRVIMYADRVTESMQQCIDETDRRRARQEEHNEKHGITPRSVVKKLGPQLVRQKYGADEDDGARHEKGKGVRRRPGARGKPKTMAEAQDGPARDDAALAVAEDLATLHQVNMEDPKAVRRKLDELRKEMKKAASDLNFEEAARLRDQMLTLEKSLILETG
jgi:excinuclease ABC subunit B